MNGRAFVPFLDLRGYAGADLRADLLASVTVIFMAVPQGMAYAMIAGLPPAMGLYAAALPAVIGSLLRSSPHVVAGPTNALSLLVGGALAVELGVDRMTVAVTLAVLVGLMQVGAGLMGLAAIVDFISAPVVLGYITGAGMLIGMGQLHHLTATPGAGGPVLHRLEVWAGGLAEANLVAVLMGLGTAALILVARWTRRGWPGALIAMGLATAVSWFWDLPAGYGVERVGDLSPVPVGLPPLTRPNVELTFALLPVAVAATVLSLVESNAVARAIAARTGQRIDSATEFFGQGMANLAAGFTGGYPVSGSLTRSVLNERAGARTRMAGALTGLMMTAVLLVLGPVVNETPVAALAGLLLVVAYDLIDRVRIRETLLAGWTDRITFIVTLIGTWALPLDRAIYLGVGISLVLFLRQARLLTIRELSLDTGGRLREVGLRSEDETEVFRVPGARILQVEGRLFFGAEGDLRRAIDGAVGDDAVRVLVLQLKSTQGMDLTIARMLAAASAQMAGQGKRLLLAGVPDRTLGVLGRTGALEAIGREYVFGPRRPWLHSLGEAIARTQAVLDRRGRPAATASEVSAPFDVQAPEASVMDS